MKRKRNRPYQARFMIDKKEDVNKVQLKNALDQAMDDHEASSYYRVQVLQKNVSDDRFLPERTIFSLPLDFVNIIFNYAYKKKIPPGRALEHFLTHEAKKEVNKLRNIKQRPENNDNQSVRLHNAIEYLCQDRELARQIIKDNAHSLNAMIAVAQFFARAHKKEKQKWDEAA